ncbi:integrase [Listeria welshimeri]
MTIVTDKAVQQRLRHENSKLTLDIYALITNNSSKKTDPEFADMMANQ